MAINSAFLDMIVYVYPTKELAESGESIGGSGFLVSHTDGGDTGTFIYVITNAHVIEKIKDLGCQSCAIRFNTKAGEVDIIEASLNLWEKHQGGDDLAAFFIKPSPKWRYSTFSSSNMASPLIVIDKYATVTPNSERYTEVIDEGPPRKSIEIPKIGIGEPIITIGRYSKHAGKSYNLPVARFGNISMLPYEPVYQEHRDFWQDSFLIECHSINGLSGSPVFLQTQLLEKEWIDEGNNSTRYKEMTLLLGIDWGHFDFRGDIIDPKQETIKLPSGMSCAVPAWKLKELLDKKELYLKRFELNNKKKSNKNSA